MSDDHDIRSIGSSEPAMSIERAASATSTAPSETNDHGSEHDGIHHPIPTRPRMPSRTSSGPMIVPRDSSAVGPVESHFGPDDVRAMSPRRTSEDIDRLSQEAREELKRHAKALQDSLASILNRVEAVKTEHDKLDSNNRFLQKYIGDLMSTSKITATSARSRR